MTSTRAAAPLAAAVAAAVAAAAAGLVAAATLVAVAVAVAAGETLAGVAAGETLAGVDVDGAAGTVAAAAVSVHCCPYRCTACCTWSAMHARSRLGACTSPTCTCKS